MSNWMYKDYFKSAQQSGFSDDGRPKYQEVEPDFTRQAWQCPVGERCRHYNPRYYHSCADGHYKKCPEMWLGPTGGCKFFSPKEMRE